MKDDTLYVAQILDALTKIEKFASGVTLDKKMKQSGFFRMWDVARPTF